MKKTILALAVVVACTACSHAGSEDRAFEWTAELPEGAVVHLLNGSGSIDVKAAAGQSAQIVGGREWRRGRARDVNFVVTHAGRDYYVCAMWRNSGKCGSSGYRGKNTGGFLAMFSLFHRTTDATAELTAELPANVRVEARLTSGDVDIRGITGGVAVRTVNGDISATNVAGRVSLASTNGDLELAADPMALDAAITLSTTNGDIRAALPPGSEGAFDVSTVNGDVRSDFPLATIARTRGNHLRGQLGESSRQVRMKTVNGDVIVTRASVEQE